MKRIFMLLALALMLGAAIALSGVAQAGTSTSTAASPTQISYVCVNKSSGQLFYLSSCTKSQIKTDVSSLALKQFKACYQTSNGLTRKVSDSTSCGTPRKMENTIEKVPADSVSLYFCVKSSDGTMYFKPGTTAPTCPTGQYAVVIGPHNQAPVANDDSATVDAGGTVDVDVLANDTDADGDTLNAVLVSGPSNGTLTLNSDGSFSYKPNADYNGVDSFTYKASDGTADSNVATATITVNPTDAQCQQLARQTLGSSFNPDNYTFHAGTAAGDTFTGTYGQSEVFCGFGGDDSIGSLQAGNIFIGGDGQDTVNTNDGTFNGGAGDDSVTYNYGTFNGDAGDDNVAFMNYGTFNGDAGDDNVYHNRPGGTFNGGADNDYVTFNFGTFEGGDGIDNVDFNELGGTFDGGADHDQVAESNYGTFNGDAGDDSVTYNQARGTFNGGDGNDSVNTNYGTFNGGAGDDSVTTINTGPTDSVENLPGV